MKVMPQGKVFDDFDEVSLSLPLPFRAYNLPKKKMTFRNVAIAKKSKIDQDKRDPFRRQYPSLFHWIVNSDMPESELADERLAKEAQVIQAAGSTSTARTLTHITYYVLANPKIQGRLSEELREIMAGWPNKVPSWVDLEGIPYLQAVLKEGLR
jgi:cytochrome P450